MADAPAAAAEVQNGSAPVAASFTAMKAQVAVPAERAEEAVAFYKAAFAAEQAARFTHPKRKGTAEEEPPLLRAELRVAAAALLVSAEIDGDAPSMGNQGASMAGKITLRLETDDVRAAATRAATAGATLLGEVEEDEDGLVATVVDPFGVAWVIASAASAKKCA